MKNHLSTRVRSLSNYRIFSLFFAVSILFCTTSGTYASEDTTKHQPSVVKLAVLLEARPDLKDALEEAILKAERPGISTLDAYYAFLDKMVTAIPTAENWLPMRLELYYIIANSPENKLEKDTDFQQWVHRFVDDLGMFLDTPESAQGLETFFADPRYRVDDYIVAPSGWMTYNQFFARHIKPGKRPIAGLCDNSIIVSPADSVFIGKWKIDENSMITTKGFRWSVLELLEGSSYRDRFVGGTLMQSYLSPYDYHRYHAPVSGVVKETRKIQGKVVLNVYKKENGTLAVRDELGYQFTQERGLIVIESPVGLVAVMPVGMGIVSSVNLTVDKDATLTKGEELGFFAFGGSDVIILFESAMNVNIITEEEMHYRQGTKIATVGK